MCENVKPFGALLNMVSFLVFDYYFYNKQNFRNFFKLSTVSDQLPILKDITLCKDWNSFTTLKSVNIKNTLL